MKQYKVFTHPSGQREAVKQGWSWPGLFFAGIWALVKRMWGIGIGVFALSFGLGTVMDLVLEPEAAAVFSAVVGLIIPIFFGAYGNGWRESNLRVRGFTTDGQIVHAPNPDGAIAEYLNLGSSVTA